MKDNDIVTLIENQIDPLYLAGASLYLKVNDGAYNSVMIKSPTTRYRNGTSGNKSFLYCRIKSSGKIKYISFCSEYEDDFTAAGFNVSRIASDSDFLRIDLDEFINNVEKGKMVFNKLFRDAFSFETFGCCSRYKECSAAEKCLHEDQMYATACMYRKNLENGKNYYKEE